MKTNNYTITTLIKPKPEVLMARNKQIPLKWLFSKIREEKEKKKLIINIGTTIKPRTKEIFFLQEPIYKAEEENKKKNLYFDYSSSWGLLELRTAIANYLLKNHQLKIDPLKEIMITRGVMDSYEKILQSVKWDGIITPSWTPAFIIYQAILSKIPIIRVPLNIKNGNIKLEKLKNKIDPKKRWLLVLNHPAHPIGLVMDDDFITKKLFPFCKKNNIFIFSETYFNSKRLDGQSFRPLLSFNQAKEICVEVISLHREVGTPGIRVGAIIGNEELINTLRIVSSIKIDIIPPFFQLTMAHILSHLIENKILNIVMEEMVQELKEKIIPQLEKMKWPFILPEAGIEMVVRVPPCFVKKEIKDPALFAAFVFLKRYQVVFDPCSVISPTGKKWLLIELRQKENQITEALERMEKAGFSWSEVKPTKEEINIFLKEIKRIRLDFTKI